jgi:ribosomal protein S18 acetylase RimI-like enzyme
MSAGTTEIRYATNEPVTRAEFLAVLAASGLAERRPVDDPDCIDGMLANASLTVTARAEGRLVGIARSLTDFVYAAYLSDLAVDRSLQRSGVGKELVRRTQAELGPRCSLILLAAPQAVDYYPRIGFEHHPQAWMLRPGMRVVD